MILLEFLQQFDDVLRVFVPGSAHPAQLNREQERVRRLVGNGTAQLAQSEPARVQVQLHQVTENAEGGGRNKKNIQRSVRVIDKVKKIFFIFTIFILFKTR